MQELNPLDRRNMTPEQLEAEAARKAQGQAIRYNGRIFEEQLQERFGGTGNFKGRSKDSVLVYVNSMDLTVMLGMKQKLVNIGKE